MPSAFLSTYGDLCDVLCTTTGGGATSPEQKDVRLAAFRAYQHFASLSDWAYYKRAYRIHMAAPYSTGTLTYTHTGGSSERLVTFSTALSSTVQGWVASGKLVINDVVHEVESYKTTTTVTLSESLNPGANVAAGTSFTLYRTSYDMPGDFRGAWDPTDEDALTSLYVPPERWHLLERIEPNTTTPWHWTILPSENSYGCWSLRVHGYPSAAESLDFMYQGRPRPIRYTGYETNSRAGTVTISADSTTVTGTSTAFSSGMIGSLIRVSSDTSNFPTGMGDLNTWAEQKVITAVASTTSLTVDSAFDSAYTATKYTISDPLDVDEDLYELLVASAELEFAKIRRHDRIGICIGVYKSARTTALENNSKRRASQQANAPIFMPWYGGGRVTGGPGNDVEP